jgi:NAD+ synthetase
MKIAIAQLNPTIGDLTHNAQNILGAAQQAVDRGAQLLLTPELSLCGYPPRDLLLNPSFIQALGEQLQTLAQALPLDLMVLVGTVETNPKADQLGGKPLFNSVALLQRGMIQQIFHKRLLPTYDVFDEDRYFEPGTEINRFSYKLANSQSLTIGVTICEDLWNNAEFWGKRSYQVDPIADLAAENIDLILNLSASPYIVAKQVLREKMLHHVTTHYNIPVVYANQVGGNDDLIFDGYSVALDRQGNVVARAKGFDTDLVILEFNPETQNLQAFDPPEPTPLAPCNEAEIWSALVLGVRDYARKCGFSKIVLGLSGGIDSALVATIAAAAIGPENVLAVLMPSPYSSDHSITDAVALAENLGISYQQLPIQAMMESFDHTLTDLFAGREPDVTEENLQSRIRGTLLMAIANKFGHLLLSTGNKSEMAVGYCTLYGDMDGGLAAIADVPKTQVYKLCEWINKEFRIPNSEFRIPPNILSKPPSAELKPGQVDQDSLPPYDVLDDILDRLIHQHQSVEQIVAAGFEVATVQRIWKLVMRSEFKRRQAPPGLKITDRAFGTGWRMPIASRW